MCITHLLQACLKETVFFWKAEMFLKSEIQLWILKKK